MDKAKDLDESKFTLTKVLEAPGILVYRMSLPGWGRWESTDIMFTSSPLDERIIITGDFEPGKHTDGVISNHGYGLAWFVRQSDDSAYLCEKFLRKGFHQELAREVLAEDLQEAKRELAEDDPDDRSKARLEKRIATLQEDGIDAEGESDDPTRSAEAFSEFYYEVFQDSESSEGAYGYDPGERKKLCKIQQRFARLYAAMESEPVPSTTPTGEAPKC